MPKILASIAGTKSRLPFAASWGILVILVLAACAVAQTQQPRPLTAISPQKGGAGQAAGRVTQSPPEAQTSIVIACESAVELMLVDPKGRRLGGDPNAHKAYEEIPAAYYDSVGLEDDETGALEEDPGKDMFIANPVAGSYHLDIAGTRSGVYTCAVSVEYLSGATEEVKLEKVPVREGEVHHFAFEFDAKAQGELRLRRD
jgi:hypothetical protein